MDEQQRSSFNEKNQIDIDTIDEKLFAVVGLKAVSTEQITSKPYSYWKTVTKILLTSKTFIVCAVILLLFIVLMFVVPAGKDATPLPGHTPGTGPVAPSAQYVFGLGLNGQDFWIQIWAGMRTTLLFSFLLTVIQLAIGVVLGCIWGYFRRSDLSFIQLTNFLSLVPQLIILLFIIFLFKQGYWPVVFGVSIQAWISIASTIRVQIMLVKNRDYNTASISLGTRANKIITRNIMPRILPVIVQTGAFAIPNAISVDSTLSYLGFGFVSGRANTSLGKILNEVMAGSQWQIFPHLIVIPIVLIMATSIIFFLVGKVFADSLDPKNHR